MYLNYSNVASQKPEKMLETHTETQTYSRVLDEIAEVTRNNNVMKTNDPNHFSNLTNSSNFKICENSKPSSNQTPDQNMSSTIKKENEIYSEMSDDEGENIFNCHVELIEGADSCSTEDNKLLLDSDMLTTEDEQNEGFESISNTPKIHLKTVDEINRKCIVTTYLDNAKRRRREVNRRYYLKRKQQQRERNAADLEMNSVVTTENVSQPTIEDVRATEVPEIQPKKEVLEEVPEFAFRETIKTEESFVPLISEPMVQYQQQSYVPDHYTETYIPNYPVMSFPESLPRDPPLTECERYLRDTKKMRSEINRRYYLKRKRKIQQEKGITDRVIIKNDAYLKRRERNRRYYLKKKQKLKSMDPMDDSSNSQTSSQFDSYPAFPNEISDNQFVERNFESELAKIEETDLSYSYMNNEAEFLNNEIKQETHVDNEFTGNYLDLTQNFQNQVNEGWTEDQNQVNDGSYTYEAESNVFEAMVPSYSHPNVGMYLEESARKRQERNRRYYLKHKEKLRQQRLDKSKKES